MGKNELIDPAMIQAAEQILVKRETGNTLEQIATMAGVSVRQLYRWRQDPNFRAYMKKRSLQLAEDSLGDVMEALTDKAKAGHTKSIEIYLKSLGVWNESLHLTATMREDDRSNENITRDIEELERQLRELEN